MSQPIYCPRCGAAMQRRLVDDRERDACPSCGFIFYRNPVPAVGVVVALEGRVVLVRRRYEPRAGCWALPAGFMELDESAEDAAMRECHEETGLLVRVEHLLGVYSFGAGQGSGLLLIYAATATGGALVAADDATEVGTFAPDALPAPMAFATHLQAIDHWRRQTRLPSLRPPLALAPGQELIRYADRPDIAPALELLLGELPSSAEHAIAAEALLHDRLHSADQPVLVLTMADGRLGGVALLSLYQSLRGWQAILDDLVVAPALRRQGHGRALVAAAAGLARARGAALLQVGLPSTQAGAFLAACGFGPSAALPL